MISVSPSNACNPSSTAISALGTAAANSAPGDFRQALRASVGAPQAEGPAGNAAPQNPSSGKGAVPQDATVGQKNSSAKRSADAKPSTKAESLAASLEAVAIPSTLAANPPEPATALGLADGPVETGEVATATPASQTETIPAGLRSVSALQDGLAGLQAAASAGGVTIKASEPSVGKAKNVATPEGSAGASSRNPQEEQAATPTGGSSLSASSLPHASLSASLGRPPMRAVPPNEVSSQTSSLGASQKSSPRDFEAPRLDPSQTPQHSAESDTGAAAVHPESSAIPQLMPSAAQVSTDSVIAAAAEAAPEQAKADLGDAAGNAGWAASRTRPGQSPASARADRKAPPSDPKAASLVSASNFGTATVPSKTQDPPAPPPGQNAEHAPPAPADGSSSGHPAAATAIGAAVAGPQPGRTSPSVTEGEPASPPQTAHAPQDGNSLPTPITVQSARVLERMGQTEMRVGVNTAGFGSVELHASVNQDRVGAVVATNHLELRAAMMAEMPSLQKAMEQHHLRLDSMALNARAGSQDDGRFSGQQSGSQRKDSAGIRFSGFADPVPTSESLPTPGRAALNSSGLNVHA